MPWGGGEGGNGILVHEGYLYFAPDDAVYRQRYDAATLQPVGERETVVSDLPSGRSHSAKSIAIDGEGALYVNIGAPSNACQREARSEGSPGLDPCPQLETRGGIWRFEANATDQTQASGSRFATGLRNVVALRVHPELDLLFGAQHGRDQLHQLFPNLYTEQESSDLPAEEFVRIGEGDDFGWPYCYYDWMQGRKVLAPEYGGDGETVGRCAEKKDPLVGFPGHWAPNDLEFYTGSQFPEEYRGGAFIAFHGSWNRHDGQQGFNVVFQPMDGAEPAGEWTVFAEGFQDLGLRPVGLAMAPDGALFVSDSRSGRIWRIVHGGME